MPGCCVLRARPPPAFSQSLFLPVV
jgi:hypothetical protein